MPDITFGTDGWRAVVAEGYTFENLERVARATAAWLRSAGAEAPKIALGHDARFMGRRFAEHVARVFADEGATVLLGETITATPAISWATKAFSCDAGIVITASHNPPEYNGFKIKAPFGGPAFPATVAAVEKRIAPAPERARGKALPAFGALVEEGIVTLHDLRAAYLDVLRECIDTEAIAAADLRVAHDAMYGAGQGLVSALIGHSNVVELHSEFNPGFGGMAPEPIERNLEELSEAVVREGCACGLANDGDADRIGMFDEGGRFVSSHEILALLVKYLHEERGLSGTVVKTFSTTHLLDKMGGKYGLEVETTPIGFKHIAPKMVEGDVLVGGEESGGIAAKGHLPERDGIYIGLLIVEMMVRRAKKLSELVAELYQEFGPHHQYRDDLRTTDAQKEKALDRLEREGGLDEVAGHAVERLDTLDGYKHITDNGWLLVRPSGTEPVLRIYSEAETPDAARALVKDAAQQLGLAEAAESAA